MNVLLINPPWRVRKGNIWRGVAGVMPPLGLAWIASVLEREGHRVQILDAQALGLTFEKVHRRLEELGPFDWVGISASTPLIAGALAIAAMVKAIRQQTRVAMGGVHPTVLPEEVLSESCVDVVVRGEGEETMKELVAGFQFDKIAGISFRRDGAIQHNPPRTLIADLDSLPMPAYHLLPMRRYRPAAGACRRLPAISMLTSRGCVGRCTFCYRIFGDRLRRRSGRAIAQEIAHLRDRYGIREIAFYDDTFTAVKSDVLQFCQSLKDLKIDLTWSCFSRVDTADEETLRTMKESGCHQITYGFESAGAEVLRNVGKRAGVDQARHVADLTRKAGIAVRGTFMFGSPGETAQTLRQTLRYAVDLKADLAVFNITTPFPGTEMFDWADKNCLLKTRNWADYDLAHVVMDLPTVSAQDVQDAYRKAYRRFYLRPRYIARRIADIRGWADIAQALRALRAVMGV